MTNISMTQVLPMEQSEEGPQANSHKPKIKESKSWAFESLRQQSSFFGKPQVQSHRLPQHVVWAITLLIPLVVAVINYVMVSIDVQLVTWKFRTAQDVFEGTGLVAGACALAAICLLYGTVTALLVCCVAPSCAGSGLPEAKGYLNGNHIPDLFSVRSFLVRTCGIILSTASGFPVGREGPMVCIGGCVGFGVVQLLALPHVRRWVEVDISDIESQSQSPSERPSLVIKFNNNKDASKSEATSRALLIDEERFSEAQRLGAALGGAAGIAVAFNAPVGGILYMFEEVTVTSWAPELTFRAFVGTVIASLFARFLLHVSGQDVHQLVLYSETQQHVAQWHWEDVPFFVFVAAFAGLMSALFSKALLAVWSLRQKSACALSRWQPYAKIIEVMSYCVVCALVFALLPEIVSCVGSEGHHRLLAGDEHGLSYVRHTCPEGQHNEVATILLSGAEGAVKHLFSRNAAAFHLGPLAVAGISYSVLAMGMPGLSVPMGCFVPSMLIGAIFGRFVGEAVGELDLTLAHPGVYALIGSAGMLGGFTHMTLAIVVLLVEAAYDLSLISPLMLSISVSHIVSKLINHHGYDEVLIMKKGVPFLDADIPHDMDSSDIVASELCERMSEYACLKPNSTVASVRKALETNDVSDFPVLNKGTCIGIVARARLEAVLHANQKRTFVELGSSPSNDDDMLRQRGGHLCEQDKMLGLDEFFASRMTAIPGAGTFGNSGGPGDSIPVHTIMDPAPYMLLKDTPAPRIYPLFSKAGAFSACVVSKRGEFEGLVSRRSIMESANELHMQHSHKSNEPIHDIRKADVCSTGASSLSAQASLPAECSVADSVAGSELSHKETTVMRVQSIDRKVDLL